MKPWFGVTPAPRGWGYYADELGFMTTPPSMPVPEFKFTYIPSVDTDTGNMKLDEYVNGVLSTSRQILEEALTTTVVDALRKKGWTVTPPPDGLLS